MVKCCVVGCSSGYYKNNTEKITQFSVPKDEKLRAIWARAIPRDNFILSEKHFVCSKHFHEDEIIRFWQSGTIQIPYKQFKLKIGAVPSIFPGPKYLSKTLKRRKDPAIRKFDVPSKKIKLSIPNNLPNYVDENVDVLEQCSNVNNLFNEIANHDNLSSIIKWPFTLSDSNNDVKEQSYNFVSLSSGDSFPIVEKAIKVSNSGTITFGIFGKEISNTIINITPGEIIRQSSGPNDHPTTPTFLHLYKILSIYSVLKPPKYGNCSITYCDVPQISLADLREIFHDKENPRVEKINKLKIKLDKLIEEGQWEPCDIFPNCSNNEECSVRDCIVYYICGYVTKKLLKWKKCLQCINFFKNSNANHPAAELVSLKSKGQLIYPNSSLYEFLSTIEHSFALHCHEYDVFDKVIDDITGKDFNFNYTCLEHVIDVTTEIIVNYIQMRLRQFSYQENLKMKKVSMVKKKISKLYNT